MRRLTIHALALGLAVVVAADYLSARPAPLAIQPGPPALTDIDFWSLVTGLSEAGGVFAQQLMSNEDSVNFVVPRLKETIRPGGIYVGVGSEQNFTYVAATQPRLAFVVDIRRDNMLQMLMYKALFERSVDRADFVSRLFARKRPDGVGGGIGVTALFSAFAEVPPDATWLEQNVREVIDALTQTHGFPLTQADRAVITRMMQAFRTAGPGGLKGWGDRTNPTYAELMASTDLAGRPQGFLVSEESYLKVRALERKNLIVPLVGDFAGDKTLPGIARFLKDRNAVVDVFYVSNVERYLFEQGEHGKQFYVNLAALPLAPSSVFIRSVTRAISQRLGIAVPQGATQWWTFLSPIQECLSRFNDGRIHTYGDLFATAQ
jgi:hypothetical protein